jgi:hypothetical protein
MKTVRSGHYSTTIKIGYNNNIIVDVVKIVGNPSETRWRLTFNETLVNNKKDYYFSCKADAVKRAYELAQDKLLTSMFQCLNASFPEFKNSNGN